MHASCQSETVLSLSWVDKGETPTVFPQSCEDRIGATVLYSIYIFYYSSPNPVFTSAHLTICGSALVADWLQCMSQKSCKGLIWLGMFVASHTPSLFFQVVTINCQIKAKMSNKTKNIWVKIIFCQILHHDCLYLKVMLLWF